MSSSVNSTTEQQPQTRYLGLLRLIAKTSGAQSELERWQARQLENVAGDILFGTGLGTLKLQQCVAVFDKDSRESAKELTTFEKFWIRARVLELFAATTHPNFCKFCYRSAWLDPRGRPTKLCRNHSQSGPTANTAGYQRGLTYQASFTARLGHQQPPQGRYLELAWTLANRCLESHYHNSRANRDDALSLIDSVLHPVPNYLICGDGISPFSPANGEDLDWRDHLSPCPTYKELATTWRELNDDQDGVTWLADEDNCITPLHIYEQWIRFVAWRNAGDYNAPHIKGRPLKIDPELAMQLRSNGHTVAQIADRLKVAPVTVKQFLARQRKKQEKKQ